MQSLRGLQPCVSMDIDVMDYIIEGRPVLSTECVFCLTCTTVCPENILTTTFAVDRGGNERICRPGDAGKNGVEDPRRSGAHRS